MIDLNQIQNPKPTGIFKKLHIGFKYAAIAFFLMSSWTLISSCFLLFKADRITGTVVEIVSHTSHNRKSGTTSTSYKPVFEYSYKGEIIRSTATFGSGNLSLSENDTVEMLVNPITGAAKANTFLELWFLPLMLASVGGFFLIFVFAIKKFAIAFQGFGGLAPNFFAQAFKDVKPGSTEEVIIIKYKDGKREI